MPERPNTPQVILRHIQGTQLQMFTTTGKHSYVLDEPETRGGTDLAATPFEFFIAGHAGWGLYTLLGAAKAKGIHIDDVEVHAEFKRNLSPKFHADFHSDPERRKLSIGVIRTSYYIHGDVSEEQKAELLDELANCPIHNTLMTPPRLEERIVVLEKNETAPKEIS